jgi:hypothetical protein
MSKVVIGLCAFVMLMCAPSVYADPLVITSGTLTVNGSAVPTYNLVGTNFSFTGGGGDTGNSPATGCHPCSSIIGVNLSSFFVGTSLGGGSATLNGTAFNPVDFLGTFNLGAGSVLLSGTSDITVTIPFAFAGDIQGCGDDSLICSNVVFGTQQLVGQGTVTAMFTFSGTVNGATIYDFKSLTYNFTDPASVPEPMTLTLLATGLIGIAGKLRHKRHITRSAEQTFKF